MMDERISILLVKDDKGFGVQLLADPVRARQDFDAIGSLRPGQSPYRATLIDVVWTNGLVRSGASVKEVTGEIVAGPGEWKIGEVKE